MRHVHAAACLTAVLATVLASAAQAQEPGAAPVPSAVAALEGCWRGEGAVMGKPVVVALNARPIALGALFLVEADSRATDDPADRYAAHLIFGGRAAGGPGGVSGFFADSFGGGYAATGSGSADADGFQIAYAYPDATFVNRWTVGPSAATWTIVARDETGADTPFATYALTRTPCAAG